MFLSLMIFAFLQSERELQKCYLALWLGYIEWMCWLSNTCDWSCRFSTCSGSLRLRVSASQTVKQTLFTLSSHSPINTHCWKKNSLPGLNSMMAFRQANSVGSTARALKRLKTSSRMRRSAVGKPILACSVGERSGRDRRGQLSVGRDHWIAHRRNISLQASSRRITWGQETYKSHQQSMHV